MPSDSDQGHHGIKSFLTPKIICDIKFCLSASIVTLILIFYYAWLMKKLLKDPHMSSGNLLKYFGTYVIVFFLLIYVLLYVIYPVVYKDFLDGEKDKKNE